MSKLDSALQEIGANRLLETTLQQKQWQLLCDQYSGVLERASANKPDVTITHHLLGVLTKAHIESQAIVENHKHAIQSMQETLANHLDAQQANKFDNQSILQLESVTHLWLYLQGYLKMDFSLANDHAEQTALVISEITRIDSQQLRTHFLQSFYLGDQSSPVSQKTHPLFAWLKSLFQ